MGITEIFSTSTDIYNVCTVRTVSQFLNFLNKEREMREQSKIKESERILPLSARRTVMLNVRYRGYNAKYL